MRPFLGCLFAAALATPAPVQEEPAVLRVTARLVQVNVIVHDRKGQPVSGLTKDDFILFDGKQEQRITHFSAEPSMPGATAAVQRPAPLPAGVYTNRPELRANAPSSVTAILLDGLNTRWEDQAYARRQVINFLGQLKPGDRIALFSLGRELRVLHDFSSDTDSLVRAIQRYRARINNEVADSDPTPSDTGDEELDAILDEFNTRTAEFLTTNRVRTTLNALKAISEHLSRIPGRKNLIWVSGGFPASMGLDSPRPNADRRSFFDDIEDAGRSLNHSSLAVYPVDARGLVGIPDFGADRRSAAAAQANRALRALWRDHETMLAIAERTGGKAFFNTNDIKSAIRRAIDDSRVTYTLGYQPSHGVWDGSFREIKVKLRKPGLTAYYRRGYHAYPERPASAQERRAALREALWSPLEATAIGVTVQLRQSNKPKPNTLLVGMKIDPRNVGFEMKDGKWHGRIDVLMVQTGLPGKSPALQDAIEMNLEPETYRQMMNTGIGAVKAIERAAGASALRVVVRDVTTGSVGSVNIPLAEMKPPAPLKP